MSDVLVGNCCHHHDNNGDSRWTERGRPIAIAFLRFKWWRVMKNVLANTELYLTQKPPIALLYILSKPFAFCLLYSIVFPRVFCDFCESSIHFNCLLTIDICVYIHSPLVDLHSTGLETIRFWVMRKLSKETELDPTKLFLLIFAEVKKIALKMVSRTHRC